VYGQGVKGRVLGSGRALLAGGARRFFGGGFGGCTVSLVKEEAIDTFIEKVGAAYKAKTGITPDFYVAEIGDGACKIG